MTLVPTNSRGPIFSAITDLTAAQLAAASTPVTLLAAQGAGTVIVPVKGAFQYAPGTVPFAADRSLRVSVGSVNIGFGGAGLNTLVAALRLGANDSASDLSANTAMTFSTSADPGFLGPIATSSLNAGGLLYSVNDTGTIDGGSTLATYKVLSIGAGGAVVTYSILTAGQGYAVANAVGTTVVTGGGDGNFKINILTLTTASGSNGVGRVEVVYYVMPLR